MNKKSKFLITISVINYLLVIYTVIFYGVKTNNIFFEICKNDLLIFTIVNIVIYLLIKYYNTLKILIKR